MENHLPHIHSGDVLNQLRTGNPKNDPPYFEPLFNDLNVINFPVRQIDRGQIPFAALKNTALHSPTQANVIREKTQLPQHLLLS